MRDPARRLAVMLPSLALLALAYASVLQARELHGKRRRDGS